MKNFKKVSIPTVLILFSLLLIACSLQATFAANQTVDQNLPSTPTVQNNISSAIGNATSGDTITINQGTYQGSGNNTNLNINKNLTFQGNGTVIIDAQKLSRIFILGNGYNVTFINLTFINANFTGNGGAIYNNYAGTTMTFINCTFINNTATTNGGAIYNTGTNFNVSNCNFINNNASGTGSVNGGGAIYNTGANFNVSNCNFTGNNASRFGGAVYTAGANFNASNCNFTNNYASSSGGAYYENGATNESFSGCNFNNNIAAGGYAGAIYSANGNYLYIYDCNLTNNSGTARSGAIYAIGTNFSAYGCKFVNNIGERGGTIYLSSFNATVSDCDFINNTAFGTGGGAISVEANTILFVTDCNFINNTATGATGKGGAILSPAHATSLNAFLHVFDCNFTNNAAYDGGGIYVRGNLSLSDCDFTNNSAVNGGGAINNEGNNNPGYNVNIVNSNFTNNNATIGGAIYNNGSTIVTNNIFNNNKANDYGGTIFNNVSGNMTVSKNTMTGNSAGLGQMIYNDGTMGVLRLIYLSNSTVKTSKGSNVTVYATLTDDMGNTVTGQDISFYVDGMFIANVTSIEGKVNTTYLVTQGPVSVIPVTGDYAGHDGYSIVLKNGELLVPKIPTKITISVPKEVKVGDTVTLESKLTDEDGNPLAGKTVDFYVDGKKVGSGVTDANGIAKLNYTFTKAGKPNVIAKFAGDSTYLASNATNSTKVSKIPTITKIKKDGNKIIVTLTDENGTPLEGKKITLRDSKGRVLGVGFTNKNGQVTFTVSDNGITLTATFTEDDTFLGSSASLTIKSEDNKSQTNNNPVATNAAMKNTGMPIIAILFVLLTSLGLIRIKKE